MTDLREGARGGESESEHGDVDAGPAAPARLGSRTATGPRRCAWCGRELADRSGPGRPATYCRQGCRQQAYVARRWAAGAGLGDDDRIVSRQALDGLLDDLYCLQAAVDDVRRDIGDLSTARRRELADALRWLLDNAEPLRSAWIEPRAIT